MSMFSTFSDAFSVTPFARDQYIFEARDGDGQLICFLRDLTSARLETYLMAPARLSFSARLDNPALSALAGWNEIRVRRKGRTVADHAFVISETHESPSSGQFEATGYDALYQLTAERVRAYSATKTIGEIVADWFGAQESSRPLTIGGVDSSISALERTWAIEESDTVLHALIAMEDTLPFPSAMWVDDDRRFYWQALESDTENQLLAGRHCLNVERSIRNDTVATRLYAYGTNEGGKRVRLSDAVGQDTDYVDDPMSRWRYSKQIVVDHRRVGIDDGLAGIDDYVMWFNLSSDASLAAYAQSDGSDIAFYGSDGVKVGHEIESFDSATGALVAWVGPMDLSATRDKVFYMYYGGASGAGAGLGIGALAVADSSGFSDARLYTWTANTITPEQFYSTGLPVAMPGVAPAEVIAEQFGNADDLLTWTREQIATARLPRASYRVSLADLEALKRYPARAYTLGRSQHVVDTDRGWDLTEAIVRVERNLLDPAEVTIDLGNIYDRDHPMVDLIEARVVDDKTSWLDADDVRIQDGVALRDWERPGDPGYMDADKIKGLPDAVEAVTHGHHIGRITAGEIVSGRHEYAVEIWAADGSAAVVPAQSESGCIVPDNAIDLIATGTMVWLFVPRDVDREAGAECVVVAGVPGGGGSVMIARHSHSGMSDGGNLAGFTGAY